MAGASRWCRSATTVELMIGLNDTADLSGNNRFEAFDEPWKIRLNTAGRQWEDKWGLMDINRNLKPGLKIPDCGGKTVAS